MRKRRIKKKRKKRNVRYYSGAKKAGLNRRISRKQSTQSLQRRRKRKTILRKRLFWDIVLFFILIASIAYLLFFSEAFKIKKQEIIGSASNGVYSEISDLLAAKLGKNFFLIKPEQIENELLNRYPEIKQAEVKKKLPNSLVLYLEKRIPVGEFCYAGASSEDCFLIDSQGIIFQDHFRGRASEVVSETLENLANGLVLILKDKDFGIVGFGTAGEEAVSKSQIEQILTIKNELEKNMEIKVERFILAKEEKLTVKTNEGWEMYFTLSEDLSLCLTKLKLLLEKELPLGSKERKNLQYIDMRFSKTYYK